MNCGAAATVSPWLPRDRDGHVQAAEARSPRAPTNNTYVRCDADGWHVHRTCANETAAAAVNPQTIDAAFDAPTTPYIGAVKRCHRHVVCGLDLQLGNRELRHDQHGLHLAAVARSSNP